MGELIPRPKVNLGARGASPSLAFVTELSSSSSWLWSSRVETTVAIELRLRQLDAAHKLRATGVKCETQVAGYAISRRPTFISCPAGCGFLSYSCSGLERGKYMLEFATGEQPNQSSASRRQADFSLSFSFHGSLRRSRR